MPVVLHLDSRRHTQTPEKETPAPRPSARQSQAADLFSDPSRMEDMQDEYLAGDLNDHDMSEEQGLEMQTDFEDDAKQLLLQMRRAERHADEADRASKHARAIVEEDEYMLQMPTGYNGPAGLRQYSREIGDSINHHGQELRRIDKSVQDYEVAAKNAVAVFARMANSAREDKLALEKKVAELEGVLVDGQATKLYPNSLLQSVNVTSWSDASAPDMPCKTQKTSQKSAQDLKITASLLRLGNDLNAVQRQVRAPPSYKQPEVHVPNLKRRAAKAARRERRRLERAYPRKTALSESAVELESVALENGEELARGGQERTPRRREPRRILTDVYAGDGIWVRQGTREAINEHEAFDGTVGNGETLNEIPETGNEGDFSFNDLAFRMK